MTEEVKTTTEETKETVAETAVPETEAKVEEKKTESHEGSSMTDAEAKLLKENMKKKAQIQELQAKQAELQEAIEKFKNLGSIEELTAMIKAKQDAETKKLEEKGEWEKLKKQMGEDHAKAMAKINERVKELEKQNQESNQRIVELTIGAEFANSSFIANELTLTPAKARVIYGSYFEIQGDKVVGYDKPSGADGRTAFVDQYGNTLRFDEALKKIVMSDPDVDSLLKSNVKSGAGSNSSKTTKANPATRNMSSLDKIMAGLGKIN